MAEKKQLKKETGKKQEVKKKKIETKKKKIEDKLQTPNSQPQTKFDPYKIIKFPLNTEKSIRMMESENKLLFVVNRTSKKSDIKKAIEIMFKAKVASINTMVDRTNTKKAFVKFKPDTLAIDIATNLGLM